MTIITKIRHPGKVVVAPFSLNSSHSVTRTWRLPELTNSELDRIFAQVNCHGPG